MKHRIFFLSLSLFLYMYMGLVYAQSAASAEVENELRVWISMHPKASQKEILKFLDAYLPGIEKISDTYYVLNTLLNSYPSSAIPITLYNLMAKIASLRFDFSTASSMYYTAFEISQHYHFLVLAALQEYHFGNINKAKSYLDLVFRNTLDDSDFVLALILKSEILLLEKSALDALKFLESEQNKIMPEAVNSAYLYQVYRIASYAHDKGVGEKMYNYLKQQFPDSVELLAIESNYVSPLPIPSMLFYPNKYSTQTNLARASSTQDGSTLEKYAQDTPAQPSVIISNLPKNSYQVGAFSNLANAMQFLNYYTAVWKEKNFKDLFQIERPLLSKKNVKNQIYYQVVFPLDDDAKIKERQSLNLVTQGIEGFMVQKSSQ